VNNMESLKDLIMERDHLSAVDVDQILHKARKRVLSGDKPETILGEEFGVSDTDYLCDMY